MKIKPLFKDKKIKSYIIICIVTILTCIPLFSKYMNISYDDGIQHICRLIGTNAALKEGNIFPVVLSDFCNGFGYSWSIFYSPLTAYMPLIFKLFTASFTLCLKLFMCATMIFSGIFMYKLVYKISNSHKAGVFSSIIYITAPYHLIDFYSRIAIAELTSFVFLPLVFLGMYNLFNDNKKTYYIAIGAIGLILSHTVITFYTVIFCFIYLLINYKKLKNKEVIKNILLNLLIILLCTSFYWLPLLEHYFETTYEVFVPNRMSDIDKLIESKLLLKDLFLIKSNEKNYNIGIPIIIGIILTFIYRTKIDKKYEKEIIAFLVFGIVSIIMCIKIFPFEYLLGVFRMIQFTWRMLIFASFFLSIVSGIMFMQLLNNNRQLNKTILVTISLFIYIGVLVVTTINMTETPFEEEEYLEPININRISGKIHPGCATFEYLPQKAYKNMEYIKRRDNNVAVLEGTCKILNENKNRTKMTFEIKNVKDTVKIELPYIYYLGYNAKLVDSSGNIQNLEITESNNGFCMIEVTNIDNGIIEINYEGTDLMKISYITTLMGGIAISIYIKKYCKN